LEDPDIISGGTVRAISEPLSHFLGGYLHQDFDRQYEDSDQAAAAYGSDQLPERVLVALGQIAVIVATEPGQEELDRAILATGCAYDPEPSALGWLTRVGVVMAKAYADRGDVDSF
jgi:hypothetical protein